MPPFTALRAAGRSIGAKSAKAIPDAAPQKYAVFRPDLVARPRDLGCGCALSVADASCNSWLKTVLPFQNATENWMPSLAHICKCKTVRNGAESQPRGTAP